MALFGFLRHRERAPHKPSQKRKRLESISLVMFLFAVFLPVRLIFFSHVSDHWLGSVGIISGILLLIYWLAFTNRLPYFGRIIVEKLQRLRHSKKRHIMTGMIAFMLIIQICVLHALAYQSDDIPTAVPDSQTTIPDVIPMDETPDIPRMKSDMDGQPNGIQPDGIQSVIGIYLEDYPALSGFVQHYDSLTGHWFSHFTIVTLVESLESLVILVYFGYLRTPVPRHTD